MPDLPEFTAEDINLLRRKAREGLNEKQIEYYKKCLLIVEAHDIGGILQYTDKMKRWLWGIKADLRED